MLQSLRFYFWWKGRLNRLPYFIWQLIIYYLFTSAVISLSVGHTAFGITALLWGWIGVFNTVKRLHDMNLRGWWILLMLLTIFPLHTVAKIVNVASGIPLGGVSSTTAVGFYFLMNPSLLYLSIGLLIIELSCLFCLRGTKGANRFGPDPKEKPVHKVLLGQT